MTRRRDYLNLDFTYPAPLWWVWVSAALTVAVVLVVAVGGLLVGLG